MQRMGNSPTKSKEVFATKQVNDVRQDVTLEELPRTKKLDQCSARLIRLAPTCGMLQHLESLRLCCNQLTHLPDEIGTLTNLKRLYLSRNKLRRIPDSIRELKQLLEFKADSNLLKEVPAGLFELSNLRVLTLSRNKIRYVPQEICNLRSLQTLEFSKNPIQFVPAEVGYLKHVKKLRLEECPLYMVAPSVFLESCPVPSLKELSARVLRRYSIPVSNTLIPKDLRAYIETARVCTFCNGPFYETFVLRCKFVERGEAVIPMVYVLCMAHWNTEEERVRETFASKPFTAPRALPSKPEKPISTSKASMSTKIATRFGLYEQPEDKRDNSTDLLRSRPHEHSPARHSIVSSY